MRHFGPQVLQQLAAEGGLARAHLAGELDEPLALPDPEQQVVVGVAMAVAEEQEAGVRGDVEGQLAEAVEVGVHCPGHSTSPPPGPAHARRSRGAPNPMRRPVIAVVGGGGGSVAPGSAVYELAAELGRRLAESGAVLLCGGGGGVMEASAVAARGAGGHTVGVMPSRAPANRGIEHAVLHRHGRRAQLPERGRGRRDDRPPGRGRNAVRDRARDQGGNPGRLSRRLGLSQRSWAARDAPRHPARRRPSRGRFGCSISTREGGWTGR